MAEEKNKDVEKLKEEKAELEKKYQNLAKILEMTAKESEAAEAAPATDTKALEQGIKSVNELKANMAAIEKKLRKLSDGPDSSKEIESVKSSLAAAEERLKVLGRLPDIESRIERIEKLQLPAAQQPATAPNIFGGFGSVDSDLYKKSIKDLINAVDALKSSFDDFKTDTEKKRDELEKQVAVVWSKLDPQTISAMEKFSKSRDEIVNEIIPNSVHAEIDKILSAFSRDMGAISEGMKELLDRAEKINLKSSGFLSGIEQLKGRVDGLEQKLNEAAAADKAGIGERTVNVLMSRVDGLEGDCRGINEIKANAKALEAGCSRVEERMKLLESSKTPEKIEKIAADTREQIEAFRRQFGSMDELKGDMNSMKRRLEKLSEGSDVSKDIPSLKSSLERLDVRLRSVESSKDVKNTEKFFAGIRERMEWIEKQHSGMDELKDTVLFLKKKTEKLSEGPDSKDVSALKSSLERLDVRLRSVESSKAPEKIEKIEKVAADTREQIEAFRRQFGGMDGVKSDIKSLGKRLDKLSRQ